MANREIKVLAIIAHDGKKVDLVSWATSNRERLSRLKIVATATTGQLLQEKVRLKVETVLSGPQGGDVQIASRIVSGEIDAVFFFQDPLDAHPHEPDIQAVMRVCNVHNVPIAPNTATADILIGTKRFSGLPVLSVEAKPLRQRRKYIGTSTVTIYKTKPTAMITPSAAKGLSTGETTG